MPTVRRRSNLLRRGTFGWWRQGSRSRVVFDRGVGPGGHDHRVGPDRAQRDTRDGATVVEKNHPDRALGVEFEVSQSAELIAVVVEHPPTER